jgi:hypothetical protein
VTNIRFFYKCSILWLLSTLIKWRNTETKKQWSCCGHVPADYDYLIPNTLRFQGCKELVKSVIRGINREYSRELSCTSSVT